MSDDYEREVVDAFLSPQEVPADGKGGRLNPENGTDRRQDLGLYPSIEDKLADQRHTEKVLEETHYRR